MPKFTKVLRIGLVSLLVSSCSTEPSTDEQVFIETRKIFEDHIQAHYDKNAQDAVKLYHQDFKFYFDGGVDVGRNIQEEAYSESYKRYTITHLEYTSEEFKVAGNLAYENGIYKETIKLNNNDSLINVTRRYMAIWTFTDSTRWKMWQAMVVKP